MARRFHTTTQCLVTVRSLRGITGPRLSCAAQQGKIHEESRSWDPALTSGSRGADRPSSSSLFFLRGRRLPKASTPPSRQPSALRGAHLAAALTFAPVGGWSCQQKGPRAGLRKRLGCWVKSWLFSASSSLSLTTGTARMIVVGGAS